jgi:SAM-dependent methyltransferase
VISRVKNFLRRIFRPGPIRYRSPTDGNGAAIRVVVERGGEKFSIDPDAFDDFQFKSGDHLSITPSGSESARTPDQHIHVLRSDGMGIRIPPAISYTSFQGHEIPDHLIVLTGAGGETLEPIGKAHVSNYIKFMGLSAGAIFMEIGCGIGRDAFQLIDVLGPNGHYVGIDVTRDSIAWCKKNITSAHPNFEFYHFNAEHELYNPLGTKTSMDFNLPAPEGSVDRIALGSVFTHLFEEEVVHYMKEIGRVLKPGGLAYATFFLYSDETIAASRKNNLTSFNLRFEHPYGDGCFVNDPNYPTGAVAFTDDAMQRMIKRAGLRLERPYLKGWWSGLHAVPDDGQEVAILARESR